MGYPTTAKGKAFYTYAFTPDTAFSQNIFTTKVRFSGQDAIDLQKKVDELCDASHKKASEEQGKKVKKANPPYKEVLDDNDNPTGQLEFHFKENATINTKNGPMQMRVAVFDAKGAPIAEPLEVGNGSTVKVAYEPYMWFSASQGSGVKLRFKGLQIVDLKVREGTGADSFGFGSEDGYSHDNNNNNVSDDDNDFFEENHGEEEDF